MLRYVIRLLSLFLIAFQIHVATSCDRNLLDIMLIIDSSGSVGTTSFEQAKTAITNIVKQLNVAPGKVHVGIIQYDAKLQMVSSLIASDQDKSHLLAAISNMKYTDGPSTNTGDALVRTRQLFSSWRRSATPRIAAVFTDGYSNAGANVNVAADELKKEKVDIFTVGIGPSINHNELNYVSSYPTSTYKLVLANYQQLIDYANYITQTICHASAYVDDGEIVNVKSFPNEVRNFQTIVNDGLIQESDLVVLELNIVKGISILNYSFSNTNPSTRSDSEEQVEPIVRINPNGTRSLFYYLIVPAVERRLYYATKNVGGTDSESYVKLKSLKRISNGTYHW